MATFDAFCTSNYNIFLFVIYGLKYDMKKKKKKKKKNIYEVGKL
ncbi:hypothetical protein HanPI659440_Chr04g0168841 [Helianthus annuus]|nr:hypothetical protein HanPI659440_Chr04g0168841 [Helianthus annuus]